MKKNLLVLSLLLLAAGCRSGKDSDLVLAFSRNDFKQHIELTDPEIIEVDGNRDTITDPTVFYLLHDSLLVVQNQPNCIELLNIYSLNDTQRPIYSVLRGQGPNEMLSCICYVTSNTIPEFYLQDMDSKIYYTVNADSILKNNKITLQDRFEYAKDLHPLSNICLLDNDRYIGYSYWYVDDPAYDNGVPALSIYSKKDSYERLDFNKMNYFVAPVSGAQIFVNPATGQIWEMQMHRDRIRIFDDSLKLCRQIDGPDHMNVHYKSMKRDIPMPFVGFDNEKELRSYSYFTLTDKHIYVIYIGSKDYDMRKLEPVEVFKFDFEGNFICDYKLDRHIYTISVDRKEEYLYGTSRSSVESEAVLVKYKL